jgi:hypothetical protein
MTAGRLKVCRTCAAGGQTLQQGRDLRAAGGEPLVVGESLLDAVERLLIDEGRDRDPGPRSPTHGATSAASVSPGATQASRVADPVADFTASCRPPVVV